MSPEMSRKWLVAFLASIGLVLVNCQTNATTITSTTISPNSNTTSPTTPAPPTTTATPKPTPSTEPPTPPKPPKPDIVNKTVENENGTCIRVYFSGIQIDITYNTSNPNITQFNTGFTIPSNASVDEANSHCSPSDLETQIIVISFDTRFEHEEHTSANLSLTFKKTDNDIEVTVVKLSFILTEDLFPQFHDPSVYGKIVTLERSNMSLFRVASAHSYLCSQSIPADLGSHEDIVDVNIDFQDPKVQAFMAKDNKDFDSAIDCKSEISDVVPIAVGAALAGLVVIVLIAYFIGRRRSRRLAYQSV